MPEPTDNKPSTPDQEEDGQSLTGRLTKAFGSPPTSLADITPEELRKRGLSPLLALTLRSR